MCAIVDANVAHEVFGDNPTPAGEHFYNWLARGNGGTLAVGGRLLRELNNYSQFRSVFRERTLAGRTKLVPDDEMASALDELPNELVESNDHHVLALANASGARLLFTNDNALQDDFRNPRIIGGTRGRIYTTGRNRNVTDAHRRLLQRQDLCDG